MKYAGLLLLVVILSGCPVECNNPPPAPEVLVLPIAVEPTAKPQVCEAEKAYLSVLEQQLYDCQGRSGWMGD